MKRTLTSIIMMLSILCCAAKKKPIVPDTLRNYPSGAIDEYCFRGGKAVVRGEIRNAPDTDYPTLQLNANDLFRDADVVDVIEIDSTGHFCKEVYLPHSQYVYLKPLGTAFLAVGDTLEMIVDMDAPTREEGVGFDGTGATGEVNRIWPLLKRQYCVADDDAMIDLEASKEEILAWRDKLVGMIDNAARAIDADTISLLQGCSAFAKDILRSNMLFYTSSYLAYGADRCMMQDRINNSEPRFTRKEYFNYLSQREKYLLDNPLVIMTEDADMYVNSIEFNCLCAYHFMTNSTPRGYFNYYSNELKRYVIDCELPHDFDQVLHQQMIDYEKEQSKGKDNQIFARSRYYEEATERMMSDYGLKECGFMMQLCLLHHVLIGVGRELPNEAIDRVSNHYAAATPMLTDRAVSYHAIDAYRQLAMAAAGSALKEEPQTVGDSIFHSIIDQYRGNVLFVDFWGLSCGPCRSGMLAQREIVEHFKDTPVKFIYISEDKPADGEEFTTKNNIKGEHVYVSHDQWNYLSAHFQFNGIPFSLLLDKKGNIVARDSSPYIKARIEDLLK